MEKSLNQSSLDLFEDETPLDQHSKEVSVPLADRMRPLTLDEVIGQRSLLAEGAFLRQAVLADRVPSMILWGPPGCGKTTLARVIAHHTRSAFENFSAVMGGIKEVRIAIMRAESRRLDGHETILFVDEIHRFNKAQQDAFLPHVEKGTVTLIGATTENPSFALNSALLSRCRVLTLTPLDKEELVSLLERALKDETRGLGRALLTIDEDLAADIAELADGDARRALNLLEQAFDYARGQAMTHLASELLPRILERSPLRHDRSGDAHYDTISAFIKSMRGSSPDAALYWAARMLEAGEDPLFLLRRILIFASEDIGNADPRALQVALSAHQAFQRLGMPEGVLPLAQAITYCATAPKSNASYLAWNEASADARKLGSAPVPTHLCNAPTQLMKALGKGADYRYPHDFEGGFVRQDYLPEALNQRRYYRPLGLGYEKHIRERLERWWGKAEGEL